MMDHLCTWLLTFIHFIISCPVPVHDFGSGKPDLLLAIDRLAILRRV